MGKIITFANYKGGVTKTGSALECGFWNAKRGKNVLMLDTDPQANLTDLLLDGQVAQGRTLPEILISREQIKPSDINTRVFRNGCHIDFVASNSDLGRIEARLVSKLPKEYIIADVIAEIRKQYDLIIFDTAPSAELLGISTLLAVDGVVIPTTLERYSVSGAEQMMEMIELLKSDPRMNPNIQLLGLLVNRYKRTLSTLFHGDFLQEKYSEYLIPTYIRECTKVQQASNRRMTIQEYDPECTAAKDIDNAFQELFNRI